MITKRDFSVAKAHGFTLIELMIVVVIMGILIALGIPSYRTWTENTKVRVLSEGLADGIHYARAEAIRRNVNVRFQLTTTTTNTCALSGAGKKWIVSLVDTTNLCGQAISDTAAPQILRKWQALVQSNGADPVVNLAVSAVLVNAARVPTATPVTVLTFNAFGRVVNPIQGGAWIDVSNTSLLSADQRNLRITVTQSGEIRSCDPSALLPTTDPRKC